jgi:hypothetical protein
MERRINNSKIVISFLVASMVYIKANGQKVEITRLKAEYHLTQQLCFLVRNPSDSILYYTVSLEKLDTNDTWFEVRTDLFNYSAEGISKEARLIKIAGNGANNACVVLKKLFDKADGGIYRIRVGIYHPNTRRNNPVWSSKFKVDK